MQHTWEYTVVHKHTHTQLQSRNRGRSYIYRSTVQNAADWELDVPGIRATSSSSDFRPTCAPEILPSSASHTVAACGVDSIGMVAEHDADSAWCCEVQSQGVGPDAEEAVEGGGRCGQGTCTTAGGMTKDETQSVSTAHTSVSRAQNEGLRNSAQWMFALFVGFSLVATAPRCIALLCISSFVPQAPMPAALDDFKAMWAPCKDPTVLFPAFGPGGILYKCLATADDVFSVLGTTIQHLCVCRVWFAVKDFDRGTPERQVLSILQHLTTALFMVPIVFMGTFFVGSARSSWNRLMWGPGVGPVLSGAVERVKMGPNYTTVVYYYTTAIVCCGLASITKWDLGVGVALGVGLSVGVGVGVCVCLGVGVGWGVGVGVGWVLGVGVTVGVGVGAAVAVAVLHRRGRFGWWSWGNFNLFQFKLVVSFGASALLHSVYYEQIAFSFSTLRGMSIIYPLLASRTCSALWRILLTR